MSHLCDDAVKKTDAKIQLLSQIAKSDTLCITTLADNIRLKAFGNAGFTDMLKIPNYEGEVHLDGEYLASTSELVSP